jgi:dTDP-4-amino-4,6-dideoxygalactose transaminase
LCQLIEAVFPIDIPVASLTQSYVYGNTPPLTATNILPSLAPDTVIGVTEIGAENKVFSKIVDSTYNLPSTNLLSATCLSLPIHTEIENSSQEYIIEQVLSFFK